MRILITGNMGYIGPVVARHLRARFPQSEIIGFDSGFFAHCLTNAHRLPESVLDVQHFGDVREVPQALLQGLDAVINLAAISNDPMGNRFEAVTETINQQAVLRLAEQAEAANVKSFVFASSCSVYGATEGAPRKESDELNPLTAYARSKIGTENGLRQMGLGDMAVTCLRFATACGMSDRLRLDLVLNDFVACAISTGEITVLSDGSPWRPLIDVSDMARAIEWAILRKVENGGRFLAVNAGADVWNYQVRDLAHAVAAAVPKTRVTINPNAQSDTRSYKVDFSLFQSLAPQHQPLMRLEDSIVVLRDGLQGMGFDDPDFRTSDKIRLRVLEGHILSGRLTQDLRWQSIGAVQTARAVA